MRYFCISFDHHYLTRGLALYASLKRHCREFHLYILCLDEECHKRLAQLSLPECSIVPLADLETADPDLPATKATKTIVDYSFTLKPCLVGYLLARLANGELLTYLDSDLYFYADPEPLFKELERGSVGIIPHRFPREFEHMEIHGIYNAGWVSIRNDEQGRACNDWWRDRCLEWCYDRVQDGRYADQGYLSEWPDRFPGVVVIKHLGANVAPWNIGQYEIAGGGSATTVDGRELIFYHFHALRNVTARLFDAQLSKYGVNLTKELRQFVYNPYLEELQRADQTVNASPFGGATAGGEPTPEGIGFDIIPRISEPKSGASIEEQTVEEYLYGNLVSAVKDRCAKEAVILDLIKSNRERMDEIDNLTKSNQERLDVINILTSEIEKEAALRSQPLTRKIIRFAHWEVYQVRKKLTEFLMKRSPGQVGVLRQHKPRTMRVEKFPQPSRRESEWPSISIVTPSFMQGAFLERTIKSVLSQNYPKLSYIVLDGGSTDDSAEIIKAYESKLARWESAPDEGQADAIARGFQDRNEDIMAWLNSDDKLMPGALAFIGDYFAANPSVDVIYGHRVIIDKNDYEIGRWVLPEHDSEILKWADYVPQETLFWRRKLWNDVGGVDTSFRFAIDWDLLFKFQQAGAKIVRLPYFLGCFRVHPLQKTSSEMTESTGDQEMERIRRIIHGRSVTRSELSPHVKEFLYRSAKASYLLALGIRR